jgi:hypothetical protein
MGIRNLAANVTSPFPLMLSPQLRTVYSSFPRLNQSSASQTIISNTHPLAHLSPPKRVRAITIIRHVDLAHAKRVEGALG